MIDPAPLEPSHEVHRPAAPLLLGVDIGTSHTKAVLLDGQGVVVRAAAVPTRFTTVAGRVEMELEGLHRGLREVLAGLGDGRRRVRGVGIAGMAESGVPLGPTGRALAPVIAWHDGRGENTVADLERAFGPDLALRIGQPVRTVLTVSKLGWLVRHGISGVTRWLGVPEAFLQALTGAEATEFSLAARTGCFDVAARTWMPEVVAAVGLPGGIFPPIRPAGAVMGRVTDEGASWSGLPPGVPVTVAGHDHPVGMVGAGVGPRDAANSVGTAETVLVATNTLPDVAAALGERVRVTVAPGGESWALLFGAARAGLVLVAGAAALGRSLEELDRLATDAVAVDVGDAVDTLARGAPASLPPAPAGAVWAGLLHALAARTADGYARVTRIAGPRQRLVVFGGGAASQPWLRAKAAVLPVPVVRSTVGSAVARGAALYAGVAAGWWASVEDGPRRSGTGGGTAGRGGTGPAPRA